MINDNKQKILNKILKEENIENEEEKQIYLDYLDENIKKIKNEIKEYNDIVFLGKKISENFKSFFSIKKGILWGILLSITYTGVVIEDLTITHINMTFLKYMLAVFLLIPGLYNVIKTLVDYASFLSVKKVSKHNYLKRKKELEKEYKMVLNMNFVKEKNLIGDNYIAQNRYLLDAKEKTKIYEKITNLINEIRNISNTEVKANFAIKVETLLEKFNETRIEFENINPDKINLSLQNQVGFIVDFNMELTHLENEIQTYIAKENRMIEDDEKVKTLKKELTVLGTK